MISDKTLFKRKIYDTMLKWKRDYKGETALLLQGARRIGKSTIVEEFAKNEYQSYILIDFSNASAETVALFNDVSDLNYIFLRLQLIYNVKLVERASVIVFDEVQKCPNARQAIKHFVKDHRYDYIETGSLISIGKNTINILIPSEETIVNMYPMDYEEFKWALDDTVTIPLLKELFDQQTPVGDVHRKMMRDFRLYMLIGGMPQAVAKYLETNNLYEVDLVKRSIISLYEQDFRKLDENSKSETMFDAIPAQLSKDASRYQISSVLEGEKQNRVTHIVRNMADSMTVNVAYHSNDPNVGLALTKDIERYKIYTADTGIFITLAFKDKDFTDNVIYEKLLNDKLSANLGYLYENMVAQMLRASGKELFYHVFLKEDGKTYYEIDFLLSDQHKITPIEVKSSGYKSHVSLDKFSAKYSDRIRDKYVVYPKDLKKENGVVYLPIYMTMFI